MRRLRYLIRKCSTNSRSKDAFTRIQNETNLSTKQIKDFYDTFKSNSNNGFIDIKRFGVLLGLLDDGLLSQMIFNAMDLNNDNVLDFYEFGRSLGIMISEDFDEKAKFSYRIIRGAGSTDENDGISFEKLLKSIRAIDSARYTLVGPHIVSSSDQDIKNFFNSYSVKQDGQKESKIYLESYKIAIQESPEFLSFFGIITPNIPELSDLEFDSKKYPSIFEIMSYLNRVPTDRYEVSESKERDSSQLKIHVFRLLEDIKKAKLETEDSLFTLERWIHSPQLQLLDCKQFNVDQNALALSDQETNSIIKKTSEVFNNDLISLKQVLETNIDLMDSIYRRVANGISIKSSTSQSGPNSGYPLGLLRKVNNRRKMYINKGNVAPNTKHRMSASEMIRKTFMHRSNSSFEKGGLAHDTNHNRTSLIQIYKKKSKISGGFQNMKKNSGKIRIKQSRSKNPVINSKFSQKSSDSPSSLSANFSGPKRTKGYVVYIGHDSWNTVLNMMIGMRLAIGRVYSEPNRTVADYDFIMKEKFFIIPRTSNLSNLKTSFWVQNGRGDGSYGKPVQFIDYNPMVFRKIREICHISPESYIRSVGPEQLLGNMVLGNLSSMNELCSEGKSGAFFYYTTDGRFLIKTVEKKTASFFRSILDKYYKHIESNPNSLITRIYGLHALRFKKPLLKPIHMLRDQISNNNHSIIRKNKIHKIFFIVMENIFHTPVEIHRRYDIKGSLVGRSTPPILQQDRTIALKELDMKSNGEMLFIHEESQTELLEQLEIDCRFFEQYNIMDYSLLIGIHDVQEDFPNILSLIESKDGRRFVGILSSDRKKVYYLGFIDFFSTWNTLKKFERLYKTITIGSSTGISAIPPDKYALRFMRFIKSRLTQ
ncbi:Phosphatidylinositol-4-phosphate 5-kinase [Cryptosporidium felis]|nr:Phosphatidylinositol-4-phosphate 5-kinase [Cryptosporidium felis]